MSQEQQSKPKKTSDRDVKLMEKALRQVVAFIEPIEARFTGIGLPTLFSWLACRTGAGVLCTAPMGMGKTLMAVFVEELMEQSGKADYMFNIQEFKKTDWKVILPAHAVEKFFHFSVQEISAMLKYSQELFWPKVATLQTDGSWEYNYPSADGQEGGQILFERCEASYFVASQPPKTHAIINDTTFRTLANDRCWNIILLNQLRGRKNGDLSEAKDIVNSLHLKHGRFTHLIEKAKATTDYSVDVQKFKLKSRTKKTPEGEPTKIDYVAYPSYYVKFRRTARTTADHITDSSLNLEEFIDCIRNQYSVGRRYEHINNILKEWGAFLNVKIVEQAHVDLFVSLFGFYINLFNILTIGSIEQSIDIRYGAVELVCKFSQLDANRDLEGFPLITQEVLCKEFNAKEDDVSFHVAELVRANILQESKEVPKGKTRFERAKSPRAVREQTKMLQSIGLIKRRYATQDDANGDDNVKPRQVIYEFTGQINDYFKIYATILNDILPKSAKHNIPQLARYLNGGQK